MQPSFLRLFTVEEANALLPRVRELLEDLFAHRDAMRERAPRSEPTRATAALNGGGTLGSEYGPDAYKPDLALGRIRERCILRKYLDTGLRHFPHAR